MTANALCSLSLDPLLALVCFENRARTLPIVRETERFAVNLLAADQTELARVFASKLPESEKLDGVDHRLVDDVPVLDGVVAWATCELQELIPGGDHTIAIGQRDRPRAGRRRAAASGTPAPTTGCTRPGSPAAPAASAPAAPAACSRPGRPGRPGRLAAPPQMLADEQVLAIVSDSDSYRDTRIPVRRSRPGWPHRPGRAERRVTSRIAGRAGEGSPARSVDPREAEG